MVKESGIVVARQDNFFLVETVQRSTCGNCAAKQGCGQHLLSRFFENNSRIRVSSTGVQADNLRIGDEVVIGIPENVLVKSALLVYLLPLLGLVLGVLLAQFWLQAEWAVVAMGCAGFLSGGLLVRMQAWRQRNRPEYYPLILDEQPSVN